MNFVQCAFVLTAVTWSSNPCTHWQQAASIGKESTRPCERIKKLVSRPTRYALNKQATI